MELIWFEDYLALAETLNFSRAAERRANQFGFSEIPSSPGIKNILLSFSGKSAA